jgi:hypothetical protein
MAPPPPAVETLDEIINTNNEHPSDQGRHPISYDEWIWTVDGRGPDPYFPPALARERFLTADRPATPEVTARQRDAPSGAKAFA